MPRKPPKSGFYGVYQHRDCHTFFARIHNPLTGKTVYLGTFATARLANRAVIFACKRLGKTPYKTRMRKKTCSIGHVTYERNRTQDRHCRQCKRERDREYRLKISQKERE